MTAPDITFARAAGFPAGVFEEWAAGSPTDTADPEEDIVRYAAHWARSQQLLKHLPPKAQRSAAQTTAAETLLNGTRLSRERFLAAHCAWIYDRLTKGRSVFVRIEDLVTDAAIAFPGLVPTKAEVAAEATLDQKHKDGIEVDQGLFIAHVLASETSGRHLCHAMLLPRADSVEHAARFAADGKLELGAARLQREGKAVHLTALNPRFLNAEDDTTLDEMEIATDVAILDPASSIVVLRGGVVDQTKYRGRRIFGAGINLTHLYRGKIPFLWFPRRELGYIHKIYRGIAGPERLPDDVTGFGREKLWVAAVDTFAIGGHCQLLLTMDYVIAGADAFMTLPARKEGIIPGLANLRLPRFVGDRIARQAIQYGRRLACDSPEGRLICDEIVPPGDLDAAIGRVVEGLTSSGAVGAIGNRRAFRVGAEPVDVFRQYCSLYAREQALCHFSPALIENLERHWNAAERAL